MRTIIHPPIKSEGMLRSKTLYCSFSLKTNFGISHL
jgi:hypothetical protein